MMKQIWVMGAALALAACGGDNTKEQMKQAINGTGEWRKMCVPYVLSVEQALPEMSRLEGMFGANEIRFLIRDANKKRVNEQAEKQMEQLVRANVYDKEKEQKIGEGQQIQRVAVYRLTEHGRDVIRATPHGGTLCVGWIQAQKINYYTEPTAVNGYTVSQVSYEAKLVPEKWATSLLKSEPQYKNWLKETASQNATLVKTNDGWRDIRELKHSFMR